MDQMLEYGFETVVSGHMALFGTPEDVQTNREYIRDLRASAAGALRMVDPREAAASAGVPDDNRQARLKVWMDAVVARAAELMPASWDKRLGGPTSSSATTSTPSRGAFTTTSQDTRARRPGLEWSGVTTGWPTRRPGPAPVAM